MRQALTLALHHCASRRGFGAPLARQPMMANVLADLAVEVEGATLARAARARGDRRHRHRPEADGFARVATPLAKFFNCSRAPAVACEALQCHGGNGFIEENPMARSTAKRRSTAYGKAPRT
jgi:putative acyl-CoA dehydrogenase